MDNLPHVPVKRIQNVGSLRTKRIIRLQVGSSGTRKKLKPPSPPPKYWGWGYQTFPKNLKNYPLKSAEKCSENSILS
jgi:hypothetical protein